jgi:hypothetical protein
MERGEVVSVAAPWILLSTTGRFGYGLVFVGDANFVPGARPDIAAKYPQYRMVVQAGWGLMILSNMLPAQGTGTCTLLAYAISFAGETLRGGHGLSGPGAGPARGAPRTSSGQPRC